MTSCNVVSFLYDKVPLKLWRALLIRVHLDRCPRCQGELASPAEARSLFVQEAGLPSAAALWKEITLSLAEKDDAAAAQRPRFAGRRPWGWAAAGIVLVVLAGYWALRDFRPGGVLPGAVAPARFELEYVRVGGQPADAYVYQPQGSDMIIVWAGKTH